MYQTPGGIKLPAASRADRKIANASKGHCTAFAVLGDNEGYRVQAESHLELCNLLILNAHPDVKHLKEQALFEWKADGRTKRHYFDVLAYKKSGACIAYTVKPQHRAGSERFLKEMQIVASQASKADFCDEVRLVTENSFSKIDLRNAAVFAAIREHDADAEFEALKAVSGMVGSAMLRDLSFKVGMSVRGYRALLRLVRRGVLQQSNYEVLSPKAHVHVAGGDK